MSELTRTYDWSQTALGPSQHWSVSLRTLLLMMLDSRFPMLIFWGPELITFYNDAFRPSLGNDGKHPSSLGQPGEESWAESWSVIGPMIRSIMAGGDAVWFDDQKLPIYRDGQMGYAYWTYSFSPLTDDDGSVNGVLVTCTETTKAVESVGQLRQTNDELAQLLEQNRLLRQKEQAIQQQLLALFEESPVAIAIIDEEQLTFRMVNSFYGQLVGRPAAALVDKPLLEALPELEGQGFDELLRQVIRTGVSYIANETPVSLVRQHGQETVYLDFAYQPHHDAESRISGVFVIAIDVTQQVVARQSIQDSEFRFRSLIEEAPIATCLFVGRALHVEVANSVMLGYWGKGPDILGKPLAEALPELTGQAFPAILEQVYTTGETYTARNAEAQLMVDGELRTSYFDFTYKPLFDETGQVYAIMDMAVDVTPQVQAQRQLEEKTQLLTRRETQWRTLVEMTPDAITRWDRQRRLVFANSAFAAKTGVPVGQLVNKTSLEMEQPTPIALPYMAALQRVLDTGLPEDHYNAFPTPEGTAYFYSRLVAERDGNDRVTGVLAIARDITELKVNEERYRRLSEELDRRVEQRTQELTLVNQDLKRSNDNLQQFTYIASHDLQEPLRKIQSFGNLVLQQTAPSLDDNSRFMLQRMVDAGSRMSTLVSDLLAFSRISTRQEVFGSVSLLLIIDDVLKTLDMAIEQAKGVVTVQPMPRINGDRSQLGQLFQNLISNALKFIPAGRQPTINIAYAEVARDVLPAIVRPNSPALHFHQISVADNGIGFEERYLDRIFQVFQRLHGKEVYPGTGIGLAICQRVAENHGGAITAQSKLGEGATFSVYLPV